MVMYRRKNNGFDDAIEPWQEKDDTSSNDDGLVPRGRIAERDD
jgi:hypothetical protein